MWDYTDKVKEHFKNPRNVGLIENADAVGEAGSIVCGDALRLSLKVDKKTKIITDAKFQTFGCTSAIAASSALTEILKGKTIDEASRVTNKDIADYLDGLPPEKMHCSVMGMEAFSAALESFKQGGKLVKYDETAGRIVCKCFNVSEETILLAIKENGLKTVDEVTNFTKAGGACGKCKDDIKKLLDKFYNTVCETNRKKSFNDMTMVEKIIAIEKAVKNDIAPKLNADGGDMEFIELAGNVVKIRLKGMCKTCPSAGVTLKSFIEKRIKEIIDEDLTVENV